MFEQLRSFILNPATQGEFKSFLQQYHQTASAKHALKPLKLGKALNLVSDIMGEPSWNHLAAKTGSHSITPSEAPQIWCLTWIEATMDDQPESSAPRFFMSQLAAAKCYWNEAAKPGLESMGRLDDLLAIIPNDQPETLEQYMLLNKEYVSIMADEDDMVVGFDIEQVIPETDDIEINDASSQSSIKPRQPQLPESFLDWDHFDLVLANKAGHLEVAAPNRGVVERMVEKVSDLVESITQLNKDRDGFSNDPGLCYFLGFNEYPLTLAQVIITYQKRRLLWWKPEGKDEMEQMVGSLKGRGANVMSAEPSPGARPNTDYDVVFSVPPRLADHILEYNVDCLDYLDEDLLVISMD